MIEWLRTSIPGIILLGAAGSILALLLLKAIRVIIHRTLAPFGKKTFFWTFLTFRTPHYVIEHLRSSTDIRELIVTSALFLSLLISFASLALLLAILMIVIALYILSTPGRDTEGQTVLLTTSFFFFICLIISARLSAWLLQLYMVYMKTADDAATAKAQDEISHRFPTKS
jgi:hypothetical protein